MPVKNKIPEIKATVVATKKNPSISKKAELTYQFGITADNQITIRTLSTTGGAIFSNEWLLLDAVLECIEKHPKDSPITSIIFNRLFIGKSANNPSMLLSHLVAEGLLSAIEKRSRQFQLAMSINDFRNKIHDMVSAKDTPATTAKKQRKAAPRKRQLLNSNS